MCGIIVQPSTWNDHDHEENFRVSSVQLEPDLFALSVPLWIHDNNAKQWG